MSENTESFEERRARVKLEAQAAAERNSMLVSCGDGTCSRVQSRDEFVSLNQATADYPHR